MARRSAGGSRLRSGAPGCGRCGFTTSANTFGTRMIGSADIRRVQEWMGHADVQTTMKYLHYAPRAEDAELVERAFPARGAHRALADAPVGLFVSVTRSVRDPDGRLVVFDGGTELHLSLVRRELLDHVDAISAVVAHPDHRAHDRRAGRERFYRRDLDPSRWLRVVVDFNDDPAWIVTVLIQQNPPSGWPP